MSKVENFLRSIYRGTVALNLTNRHRIKITLLGDKNGSSK